MPIDVDILIHPEWIIPVVPENLVLRDHSLAVRDGLIVDLLPREQARRQYHADETLELPGEALIPGLINAHTHAAMALLRGLADDLPLMRWLNDHIWPAEAKWVNEEFVHDGSQLAIAEMLLGGTTCFNDMYFFPDITARVAGNAGIRAVVGLIVIDFPSVWAGDADDYLHKGIQVHDQFRNDPLIHTAFAPHAPYSVSDAPLIKVQTLADEMELPVHIHLHETRDEIRQALKEHGKRPMTRLDDLGLLGPGLVAVHMTQLEPGEIERFAACGGSVVHCPESNLKLASGFSPVSELLDAGVNVALGTDGAASNNDLDMFGEMRTAALLAKGVSGDAGALPAARALSMATINGARALGIGKLTGSLEKGKAADLVSVDLTRLQTQPLFNPISQLVYAAGREQVTQVWVAGRRVVCDQVLTSLDTDRLLQRAIEWGEKIDSAR